MSGKKRLKRQLLQPGVVRSQADVARAFRVSLRTIEYWAEEGMPRTVDGNYDLVEIVNWSFKRGKKAFENLAKRHSAVI